MANEWSQELLNEINSAGQAFEEAALSGNPRIPDSVRQQVAENVLYRYYQQQKAAREANQGRTAHSYLRDTVAENVANPVEYTSAQLTAARNRVAELQDQVNRLTAANNSRYVSEAYKAENKAELENKQSALALAQKQQERMERDTARARQATQRRVVDEAAERGVSYKDQSEAYGQSLKEMYEQREQLRQQLNGLDKKYSRSNSDLDFETRKRMHDEEKESTTDRLEKLTREIERLEGQRNYASLNFGKDKNAAVVIKQGEELAKTLKDQYLAGNIPDPTSNADYRAWVESNTDKTARDYAEQQYADREPNDLWTQDEKNRYFTLMTINPESAFQYAVEINSAINREVNERATSDFSNLFSNYDMSKEAREGRSGAMNALMWAGNAASDIAGIAGGVATGPVKLFNWLDNIYQNNERGGYYAGNNTPRISDYTDKLLSQNAERLNSYGTISNNKPILGGKGLGDLYQLVESVAQSMAYGAGLSKVFGAGATTAAGIQAAQKAAKLSTGLIFFGQAADSSYNEYIQRGMSREQAAVGSFFAGLAEAAGEEFSIDHLISGDIAEGLAKYVAKQSFIESTEEGFTNILNLFGDELAARLTGGKSKMRQDIEALKSRGMSDERAKRQVWKQFVDDTIFDMFGGAFSGGLSAGIFGGTNKLWEMRKDSVLGKQSGAHVAGNDGKAISSKASNATDAQLEKLLVQAEKRGDLQTALFIANELINREEAGQRQRPTGDPNSTSMLAERILDGMRRKAGVIQDGDGLGETPLNDDELPPPYEEERPPMPGDEEAPPEWASRLQEEPTVGEQRSGNEPPARSDREAPPAWRSGNADLGSAQQKSALDLEFDEQLAEMRQNAARAQRASAGQIIQPNQQNAAQTVKPGNSEQAGGTSTTTAAEPLTDSTESGTVRTLNLLENIPYKGDVSNLTLEERAANLAYINRQGDFLDELEKTGSYSKEEIYRAAREIQDAIGRTVGHDLLKYQVDFLWDEAERINNGGKTNAGEQAVQQPEAAAAGETDAGRPVRESGKQAARGVLGEQRQDTEGKSLEQEEEGGTERRAPSFVTEQEVREWSDTNQAEDISPEAKTKYKAILKDTNNGTKVVTKPKTGSHLHFVQNFFKRLGIIDDVMLASNDSGSVFKDGSKGKENSGKIIMDANVYGEDLIPASAHEASHKKLFDHYGGVTAKDILNGSYNQRMGAFTRIFMNAFGPMNGLKMMTDVQNIIREDYGYGKQYNRERGGRVAAVNREAAKSGRTLGTDANALVKEMEQARALEEFINEIVAWDGVFIDAVEKRLNLTDEQIGDLRNKIFDEFKSSGVMTDADVQAINDFITEAQELEENGDFTDEELEGWPGFGLSDDLFDELDISESSNFGSNEERRRELAATLRTLISGDTEAIGRLSTDYLNYAINYTLKKADPDLDFGEKRRTYNAIANVLAGTDLDRAGKRSRDRNLFSPNFKQQGPETDSYLQEDREAPPANQMQKVLINAINELDRRGLNIWGYENDGRFEYNKETDDTGEQYETEEDYEPPERDDAEDAYDYSDNYNETVDRYLRKEGRKQREKMRTGSNWLEGAVPVKPDAVEWGRTRNEEYRGKTKPGQKVQGWYDVSRQSLTEREFARQRVMNRRSAEDLSYEIESYKASLDFLREDVEKARANVPANAANNTIYELLDSLNDDIEDLHAIDDMFRDAVREDPNSDQTKQLATEGTRLTREIEDIRRRIEEYGEIARGNPSSPALVEAEKRLAKQEARVKAKQNQIKDYLEKSRGGDTSGALVASRSQTDFDSMPDDFLRQIAHNGYVSMDMLETYYGSKDAAYQVMYQFQEKLDNGKVRVPTTHRLTPLEKTAIYGILADRKAASKVEEGRGKSIKPLEKLPVRKADYSSNGMSREQYLESMQNYATASEGTARPTKSGGNFTAKPSTVQPTTNDTIRELNRKNAASPAGNVYELSGPTPASMDRLNRMFADRLGIENISNTAIAYSNRQRDYGSWEDDSVSESSDFGSNKGQEKKPLVVDAAYTNYAAAAQSVADLHKKIMSDIMSENPNMEEKDIDKEIEDSFLGSSVRALDTAVSQIADSKDPLGAVFNLRQQIYSAKNKGEGTYAALASDAVIGMCDEIGRLIENKTMPYDEKARAYAVATTQLVSALSTRAERLYEAAHRVQRIQDKLATVTKKDRGSLRQLGTGYLIKQMNPTTLFKMLDDFDVSGKGAGYEIARALENGTVKSAELIARAARQFDEAKKTEGFQEFAEGKTIAKYKFKGEYTISELQAIEFILLARRMNGMKVYDVDTHGGVIEKTRLQTLKGFALRDADGNHIFVDSMYEDSKGKKKRFDWYKEAESMYRNLSPAAKAYMKAANKVLDGLGKEIRQTKINATGVGFSGMEGTGYYPMSYMSQKEHLPDYNANPDYEGLSQDKHLQSVRLTHGGYAVVQNAAKTVDRYIEWASNYAAYGDIADMLLTMNTSGNGRGIVNATGDAYGAQYAKAIEKYIGDINNFTDTQKNDVVNSALRGLRQKMAAGALGLSLSVPIKQVASYWDAAGILSMDSLRRAYRFKLVNEKGLGADNMFLQSRKVGNIDPTVSEMLGSGLLDSLKKRSGIIKRFAEATNTMDYRTVDNLFTATVLDVEASLPGIDKDSDLFKRAVEAKFNQVVLNTQPIFNKNARSEYQRSSNEIERALGMFRTQQTQNLNRIITSVMEARSTKGTSLEAATKRQLRQTLAGQIAGQLEFAALTAIANTVMHGWKRWRDDDDEITMESIIKRFGLDFTESIAGTAWFGDEAAKAIVDRVFGTNESFGVSVGVLSTLADTGKYFFDVVDDLRSDDPLALFDSLRKFVGSAATVAGKPVNNVYRLANAAVMWGADILKWASKGKYGNRANYDDSMKMLDAWIKGGLKEEGAKTQAAKAFRKDQPENLLYNLGILSSLTKEDEQDKGRNYLDSLIKKSGDSDAEESKNHRIVDYLVHQSVSADKIDKAVDQYGTSYQYNQFYDILRQNGHTPIQAVKKLDEIDSNGDNKITTDELQDYWKKHGHEPKENKLIEALFGPTADDFRIIKDTKTFESSTRYYKSVIDSGVTAERAAEIVDGCRSESGDVTQAGIYQYYLEHPEDIKQIQALYNSMGYKEKGQPRTWESFLKAQAKKAS